MKFLNCKIDLSKKVFKPRIETEYWVKKAIEELKQQATRGKQQEILDIFAGTGCIGIAILKNLKNSKVDFVDISSKAISQIKINLKLNKIDKGRYKIYQSNLFEKLKRKKHDFIFANPPYVALDRIWQVQKEVLKKEPAEALFAGRDGMKWIKRFLSLAKKYLKKNGKIFIEFDPLQKAEIKKILEKGKLKFEFKKDQFKKYRWLKISF
ncbi:hypothetical protein AMJ49_01295 [Parcubacteria bacterium DG_74_2]|nr:MAG: hypothetical protein AMJ49_01295 [Parcubacteria bacterium DG_74_2]